MTGTDASRPVPAVTISATYRDGRSLRWANGRVTGSPALLVAIPAAIKWVGRAPTMPEGPAEPLKDYATRPQAFIALACVVHPADAHPQLRTQGNVHWPSAPTDGFN